jgi:hypothetical protein
MKKENNQDLTKKYTATFADKLLQHTDVLHAFQKYKHLKPITIQLAPCEVCDSDCPFCSVAGRPLKSFMPFEKIKKTLSDFKLLGAKAVEITGGGNPYLYTDKEAKADINSIIEYANSLGLDVGLITNANNLKRLKPENFDKITWIRISLIKLDEGKNPEDYDFNGFPINKLAFSYIIYETGGVMDSMSRTKKAYQGTTKESIEKIAKLVELNPEIKFVRIAGNALTRQSSKSVNDKYTEILDAVDKYDKFFVKETVEGAIALDEACYVGAFRPYIAPSPHGGDYKVYICTSHVLYKRNYDLDFALCSVDNIIETWAKMEESLQSFGYPYEVNGNKGKNWCSTCSFCYYGFNNKLLHTVASEMPDKNFT